MALAGTNPTWHFIYDVTRIRNEASEWQQCYLTATAEDVWLNCRTQVCKAAGETVKDKSKSGLNAPQVCTAASGLTIGLFHFYIKKYIYITKSYSYNKRISADRDEEDADRDEEDAWGVERRNDLLSIQVLKMVGIEFDLSLQLHVRVEVFSAENLSYK